MHAQALRGVLSSARETARNRHPNWSRPVGQPWRPSASEPAPSRFPTYLDSHEHDSLQTGVLSSSVPATLESCSYPGSAASPDRVWRAQPTGLVPTELRNTWMQSVGSQLQAAQGSTALRLKVLSSGLRTCGSVARVDGVVSKTVVRRPDSTGPL